MNGKKILAGVLAALMLTTLIPTAAFAAETEVPTRAEVCQTLLTAADDYNKAVTTADIMKGDENGNTQDTRPVTRAEALVMLSRAFGPLPTPKGDNARMAYPAETFSDVPAWAQAELANVFQAGIVAGTGEGKFSPDATVTTQELETFIRRVYALFGSNLKDDFYATVTKSWMDASVIPEGKLLAGGMYDTGIMVDQQIEQLIKEIAADSHPKGSGDEKIANLYNNILDWEGRNKVGIAPIQPYLDAVDQIKTLEDCMAVQKKISEELGTTLMLRFRLGIDMKDSSKYIVTFSSLSPSMGKELYATDSGAQKDAYVKYLTTLFTLVGVSDEEVATQVDLIYRAEQVLAAAMMDPQEYSDVDKTYNLVPMKQLKDMFPNLDLDAVYAQSGFKPVESVCVYDPALLAAAAPYFDDAHIDTLKAWLRIALAENYGGLLNKEFQDADITFNQEYMGMQGSETDEALAASQVQSVLAVYLEKAYTDKYFSPEAKADVEQMISEFIEVYKERIMGLDWMSDATKKMALKKLDAMGVKVGYPDKWDTSLDKVEIKSGKEGGSFFKNMIALSFAQKAQLVEYQGKPVDKTEWATPAFTVNAFYNSTANDITFPAGILQAPMYDVNAPKEKNLGGIGYAIAHEITHAFDNNGAKFDEKGNAANWWTESDYAAFQKLCDEVVAFFDGVESAPGIACNGTLTLSENVADLGAAACIAEVVRQDKGDFEALFKAMAEFWCVTSSRSYAEYLQQADVHAPMRLRGYMPAQTQAEFYETFEIQAGDGMWIAPENRVNIW